jgi:protocatechuate 3,4-dioxygenase, alpha subunit
VLEEGNLPTRNSVVEIWQPDANGIFRHPLDPRCAQADPGFCGWGRSRTDAQGNYHFRTVLPGSYTGEDGAPRCPHINVMILGIGLTHRLVTWYRRRSRTKMRTRGRPPATVPGAVPVA